MKNVRYFSHSASQSQSTITIAPSGAVTLTAASQANFTAGDVLTVTAPAMSDPTLANVAFGIGAVRV